MCGAADTFTSMVGFIALVVSLSKMAQIKISISLLPTHKGTRFERCGDNWELAPPLNPILTNLPGWWSWISLPSVSTGNGSTQRPAATGNNRLQALFATVTYGFMYFRFTARRSRK